MDRESHPAAHELTPSREDIRLHGLFGRGGREAPAQTKAVAKISRISVASNTIPGGTCGTTGLAASPIAQCHAPGT